MSKTYELDAQVEEQIDLDTVLATRDVEGARRLANMYADSDVEFATKMYTLAKTWEREDNYYDESNGN